MKKKKELANNNKEKSLEISEKITKKERKNKKHDKLSRKHLIKTIEEIKAEV